MSSNTSLIAEERTSVGKGPARALRRDGKVPAIIYGANKETVKLSLSSHELTKLYNKPGYSTLLIDINLGKKVHKVIPRSVELHPVTDEIEHADFLYVSKDSKIKVSVNIHFVNEDKSIGIKRGGVLNIVKRKVNLLCSPNAIPNHIDVDVLNLDIGQSIHAQDLKLSKDTSLSNAQNDTIVTVVGRGGKSASVETSEAAQ